MRGYFNFKSPVNTGGYPVIIRFIILNLLIILSFAQIITNNVFFFFFLFPLLLAYGFYRFPFLIDVNYIGLYIFLQV